MEDVLEVYQRPYDPRYPVVCLDEKGKELQANKPGRTKLPAQPGHQQSSSPRQDYEYVRAGSANLLLFCEPLRGWRKVVVNQDRTGKSFAHQVQQLVEVDYPDAEKIILVSDNLNIHGIWSLYEVFPPEKARQLISKLEWHYTPEHGSWLNMAELELSVLSRQCLKQRFDHVDHLRSECDAWTSQRNLQQVKIHWHFTAADARIRLRRLYPVIQDLT